MCCVCFVFFLISFHLNHPRLHESIAYIVAAAKEAIKRPVTKQHSVSDCCAKEIESDMVSAFCISLKIDYVNWRRSVRGINSKYDISRPTWAVAIATQIR